MTRDRGARTPHPRCRRGAPSRDPAAGSSTRPGRSRASVPTRTSRRRAAPSIAPRSFPRSRPSAFRSSWHESSTTTEYSFHYEGDRRIMRQDAVGDPWTPDQAVAAAGDGDLGRRLRPHTHRLSRRRPSPRSPTDGRQLLVDLQGLVRTATIGPLHTDAAHRRRAPPRRGPQAERRGGRDARRQRRAGELARSRRAGGDPHARLAGCLGHHARPRRARARGSGRREPWIPTGAGDTYSVTYIAAARRRAPSRSRPRASPPRRSPSFLAAS